MTGSSISRRYWFDLKKKLKQDWRQMYEKIVHLKMQAAEGIQTVTEGTLRDFMLRQSGILLPSLSGLPAGRQA